MSLGIRLIVLLAALLHASWNALLRAGGDRFWSMTIMCIAIALVCLALVPFLPMPEQASWAYAALSAVLHVGYNLFLVRTYQHGDLGQTYPISRGSSPLLVSLGAAAFAVLYACIWVRCDCVGTGNKFRSRFRSSSRMLVVHGPIQSSTMLAATDGVEEELGEAAYDPRGIEGIPQRVRTMTDGLAGYALHEPLAPSWIAYEPALKVYMLHQESPGGNPAPFDLERSCDTALIDPASRATRLSVSSS